MERNVEEWDGEEARGETEAQMHLTLQLLEQ